MDLMAPLLPPWPHSLQRLNAFKSKLRGDGSSGAGAGKAGSEEAPGAEVCAN